MKAPIVHNLLPGQLLQWHARSGTQLFCRRGRALVTQEGVAQDFDLMTGKMLELPRTGSVLVEAVGDVEMEIRPLRHWWCDWWLGVLNHRLPKLRRPASTDF
jgi:hypothetical protein